MVYQSPVGLPGSGQDPGSGAVMQAIMAYLGQPKGGDSAGYDMPLAGTGGNLSEYSAGYSGYNTSIYGPLGVKTDNAY